ncbi:hypothetical protein PSA7680_00118 [Pseudoruegeria aquimaris]|uniref:DUF1127 domain-containing protein n=1 Tax=Pseudoruegeria aquimaris TaxID=393663 RepID=A0A1Y5R838_9RHOB|nr:hypothetical protein [Pseudoruegeria aquimaris]SLN11279.1 hypothetical protein PSA7680_00118 [Pseudoruegeria aquimaris]
MTLFHSLRDAVSKRIAFRRTVRAIRNMPKEIADDLGIFRGDADRIAAKAVYG